jgi:hypothetical protein
MTCLHWLWQLVLVVATLNVPSIEASGMFVRADLRCHHVAQRRKIIFFFFFFFFFFFDTQPEHCFRGLELGNSYHYEFSTDLSFVKVSAFNAIAAAHRKT